MAVNSCKGCLPPKRTPTCKFDGTCDKYAIAKEKHEQEREARLAEKLADWNIENQKGDKVRQARRRKGIKYGE